MKYALILAALIFVGCGDKRPVDGTREVTCFDVNTGDKALTVSDAVVVREIEKDRKYEITRKDNSKITIDANCYQF